MQQWAGDNAGQWERNDKGREGKNVDDVDEKRQAKPMHKISACCAVWSAVGKYFGSTVHNGREGDY